MAYNYEYPYTNSQRYNDDWLIHTIQDLEKTIANFVNLNTIKYANPILWSITTQYEGNTVVIDGNNGNAYISSQAVPSGILLSNLKYWSPIFNYDSQIVNVRHQITSNDEGKSTTATAERHINDLVWLNNTLVQIIQDMAIGTAYIKGVNCVDTTIERVINGLSSSANTRIIELNNKVNTLKQNEFYDFSRCVFLGDSYMETAYLLESEGYVPKICNILGITNYSRYGRSGSGFIGTGTYGNYLTILNDVIIPTEVNPEEVTTFVIQGGANDGSPSVATMKNAVANVINRVHAVFTNAKVIVMETPTFKPVLARTRAGILEACEYSNATWIDSAYWLTGNTDLEADEHPNHPTADGCTVIAHNFVNTLFGSPISNYFETEGVISGVEGVTLTRNKWVINGDKLSIILEGGINNITDRYIKIINYPSLFYVNLPRFNGCAYTGLGQTWPIWLTQQALQLDTLVGTAKSTQFQLSVEISLESLFGLVA